MSSRIEAAEVRDALGSMGTELVLTRLGVEFRECGTEIRTRTCPECGERSEPSVAVSRAKGLWHCKPHECSGDLLRFVALMHGHDPKRDFVRALGVVAEFAGVSAQELSAEERARLRKEREAAERARRAAQEREDREKRARSRETAAKCWAATIDAHPDGIRYLEEKRGLRGFQDRGVPVHFDRVGNVCAPLYDFEGEITSVATRYLPPREPRFHVEGVTSKTYFGRGIESVHETTGHVFIAEGILDYLTAEYMLSDNDCPVFGAQGASNIPKIVEWLAPTMAELGRHFCFAVHEDKAGADRVRDAIKIAIGAGVSFWPGIDLFNLGGASDLNDAIQKGCGDIREYD